jgi:hypothetical protein
MKSTPSWCGPKRSPSLTTQSQSARRHCARSSPRSDGNCVAREKNNGRELSKSFSSTGLLWGLGRNECSLAHTGPGRFSTPTRHRNVSASAGNAARSRSSSRAAHGRTGSICGERSSAHARTSAAAAHWPDSSKSFWHGAGRHVAIRLAEIATVWRRWLLARRVPRPTPPFLFSCYTGSGCGSCRVSNGCSSDTAPGPSRGQPLR